MNEKNYKKSEKELMDESIKDSIQKVKILVDFFYDLKTILEENQKKGITITFPKELESSLEEFAKLLANKSKLVTNRSKKKFE